MDLDIILPAVRDEPIADMLRAITEAIVRQDEDKWVGGFLGGEFGYGAHWSSDVFDMRPFYWDDCDCGRDKIEYDWCKANDHSDDCYQSELRRAQVAAGAKIDPEWGFASAPDNISYDDWQAIKDRIYTELCAKHGLDRRFGCAVHCTCGHKEAFVAWSEANPHKSDCSPYLPNFRHHATGFEVRWYKYIGRDMEFIDPPVDLSPIMRDCLADVAAHNPHGSTRLGKE